ncbi:MAG: ABC transporter permease subunit [Treponema sp.]|nr:ABC transporter permease subunit [Treponema sp.]
MRGLLAALSSSFNRIGALGRKELGSLIFSPALYGASVFFFLFLGIHFFYLQRFFAFNSTSLRPFFSAFPLALTLVVPLLTMKSWAEEAKLGSLELLLTLPLEEWELVLGKFISSFLPLLGMLLLTASFPLSLLPLGQFDGGIILAEYSGTILLGASATALGLLMSSLSKSQASAFLGTIVVLGAAMHMHLLSPALPPFLASFFSFFSLAFHFENFSRGILDSRDLAFFLLSTCLFLYLNTQVLMFRRYR